MKATFLFLVALVMAYPAFADAGLRIVVPARDIARGETISESDLSYAFVAPENALPGIVTGMDALLGKQARRVLRAGESVRADDVRRPILVAKGQTVTMVFEAPGVLLTATGKAMSEGGLGESVTVLNPVSYRQVTAIVTGEGTVRAEAGMGGVLPARIASNLRPRGQEGSR